VGREEEEEEDKPKEEENPGILFTQMILVSGIRNHHHCRSLLDIRSVNALRICYLLRIFLKLIVQFAITREF
jgi:hypothetical protein